jgi:hypothetical protein
VKIAVRVAVFVLGAVLVFFAWHRSHPATLDLQIPSPATTGNPSDVLIVVGAFVTLLAFAPSPQTLGRWMSLKRKHHAPPAQFRRRHKS